MLPGGVRGRRAQHALPLPGKREAAGVTAPIRPTRGVRATTDDICQVCIKRAKTAIATVGRIETRHCIGEIAAIARELHKIHEILDL